MKSVIVFCAGGIGEAYIKKHSGNVNILAIADNDPKKQNKQLLGYDIISPNDICVYNYDEIVICIEDYFGQAKCEAINKIILQLIDLGIDDEKICLHNMMYAEDSDQRVIFLKEYSKSVKRLDLHGAVAECGVYRGHFAHYINKYFDKKPFYMFDTFDGFDNRDLINEPEGGIKHYLERNMENNLARNGNEHIALRRCPNKQNVIIKKGAVPETFVGLESERFCFVNLDLDLYDPTLKALRWFSSRMVEGGLILVHDYYNDYTPGAKKAVDEFMEKARVIAVPIGDLYSMALLIKH